jgi:hypothetical protein
MLAPQVLLERMQGCAKMLGRPSCGSSDIGDLSVIEGLRCLWVCKKDAGACQKQFALLERISISMICLGLCAKQHPWWNLGLYHEFHIIISVCFIVGHIAQLYKHISCLCLYSYCQEWVGCVQVLSLGEVLVWKFRQDDFILCAKCIHLAFGWVTNCCELLKGETVLRTSHSYPTLTE